MKKPPMGSIVLVTTTVRRVKTRDYSTPIVSAVTPRPGWVVGYRTLAGAGRLDYHEPLLGEGPERHLIEEEPRMRVILVAYWPTMKPVQVPLHGWRETDEEPYFWSPRQREEIADAVRRDIAKGYIRRDERGRFVS